jgi:UDP-glucuronate 4-epimerase
MKLLVTGGAGFIGSHLCQRLLQEGHAVTILDDLNDFYAPEWKRSNLAEIERTGPVRFHHLDICDEPCVRSAFEEARPDVVVHLAARAGVRPSLEQPLLYERVNVYGTMVLLEAARSYGVPKFVFASSSSIYGATNKVPFLEDDHPNLPISPYAATKLAGEKVCYTYSHLYGIDMVCLRFFTVYGPRQRPDLAIRKFTQLIHAGRPVPMFGDGTAGRDYTFVDDTVAGIVAAIERPFRYEIFNLGNSHPVSLSEMIAVISRALGREARIEQHPLQPGDVPITFADVSKAARLLDYRPSTAFPAGVARFVKWFRQTQQNT